MSKLLDNEIIIVLAVEFIHLIQILSLVIVISYIIFFAIWFRVVSGLIDCVRSNLCLVTNLLRFLGFKIYFVFTMSKNFLLFDWRWVIVPALVRVYYLRGLKIRRSQS